ncbi:hypothetical protein QVD17_06368 [Tagetes erecta]|uniref:CRAL-TRIO domain-containing protein n=1 Tax=Tagetes erecta TaxID=13708 RepID=A0AAD8PBR6_TARER|nr:hypothetical protein QVD17_06368 [Tagetes erecta]
MTEEPSSLDEIKRIHKLNLFKIKGRDKRGRKILKIIGKHFPGKTLSLDLLKKYLEVKIFPKLLRPFVVVYIHTDVQKSDNFPGISVLRSVYDAIPATVKEHLEAVYFVHPDLQSRIFLATFGRFIFSGGLYAKLKYVSRLAYLWEHVKRNEIEIPEFVYDHDEDLEYRPMMDYGLESDHARVYGAPTVDSSVASYSMRCIS